MRFAVSGDARFAVNAGGEIVIAAGADLRGDGDRPVTLAVEASDGRGGITTTTVTVTIRDVPGAASPAVDDVATVAEDGSVRIAVLANDTGVTLLGAGTAAGVAGPAHGTITVVGSDVLYVPVADYSGADSFQYRVRAADGTLATAQVTVNVTPVNDAPVATPDAGYEAHAGTPLVIPVASLLTNDRDVDGDSLAITAVGGAVNGAVALDGRGNVVFTPAGGATGAAGFSYTISDGNGGSATGRVDLEIDAAGEVHSVWGASARPAVASDSDTGAVELGLRFTVAVDGEVEALRFYKGTSNTGTHTARLWTDDGHLLGSATFTAETSQGWQQVSLAKPIALDAGEIYVVSYHAPNGRYSVNENYFTKAVTTGPLTALDGVYKYGSAGSFPNEVYRDSNYWVDVVFDPDENAAPAAPTVSANSVAETAAAGTVIGRLSAADPDGDQVTFTVSDSRFAVTVAGDLIVASNATLHGFGDRVVPLTVTASDGHGGTSIASVAVTIRDMPAVGTELIGSSRSDTLTGGSARERISGLGGADTLNGAGGNDELNGGAGRDLLTGGRGADVFVFTTTGDAGNNTSRDVIRDFSHSEGDRIDLSQIDANRKVAGDQAFSFIGEAGFSGQAGELRYVGGVLSGDVNGDAGAEFQIEVSGAPILQSFDFAF